MSIRPSYVDDDARRSSVLEGAGRMLAAAATQRYLIPGFDCFYADNTAKYPRVGPIQYADVQAFAQSLPVPQQRRSSP